MLNLFEIPTAIMNLTIQNTLRAVNALNAVSEHQERLVRTTLDRSKNAREESIKAVERWANLTRESQKMFVENWQTASQKTMTEMGKYTERWLPTKNSKKEV